MQKCIYFWSKILLRSFCQVSVSNPWNTRDENVNSWIEQYTSQTIKNGEQCRTWAICLNTVYLYYIVVLLRNKLLELLEKIIYISNTYFAFLPVIPHH